MASHRSRQPRRRALSAPGGPITSGGEPTHARALVEALRVSTGDESEMRSLTHGFHSWPARFHPLLVRRLLDDATPGTTLLDPFVGSGTTLIEGAVRGLRGVGSDVNPLAVELTRLKATPFSAERRAALLQAARRAAEQSIVRVKDRARTAESGERFDDPKQYAPHVFRELVGLREEIAREPPPLRRPLLLVLSSILIKVSRTPSETAYGSLERTVGKTLPTRLFLRRAEELDRQLADFAARVAPGTSPPDVRVADARKLQHVPASSVARIITSPPYLGTYDYALQHERRLGWLELDKAIVARAESVEIGSRRKARDPDRALDEWQSDVDAFVEEFARVLAVGGRAYVVIGDSAVAQRTIAGDQALRKAAERAGLTVVAWANQERPNFYRASGREKRREHLLLLGKPSIS
jgi:DNA modification methylase